MIDVNAPSGQTPTMAPPDLGGIYPIHTYFIEDKQNLSQHTSGKKRATLIVIPSIRFTKLIIHHLQRKHMFHPRPDSPLHLSNEESILRYLKFCAKGTKNEVFGMPIPDSLITAEIQQATYYREYLAKVTHHRKYLAGKTEGVQNSPAPKPTHPARKPKAPTRPSISIPILWGIVTRTNIDYAERIWEEFTQSIHTLIVIPSIRFTKLIIHHLQRKNRFHPRPNSPLHLSNKEPVLGYLKFSAKDTKSEGVQNPPAPKPTQPARKPKAHTRPSISIPVASTQPAPTSAPAKSQENKRKQATETTDKPAKAKRIKRSISRKTRQPISSQKSVGASEAEEVPAEEPQVADEDTDYQKAVEESMKDAYALPKGPLPPVVIREPESKKYQPLPEVPGKGKAKVTEEQVAHDLLSLQKHKKTSPADQYIFQRRVSEPTGSFGHDESPYALFGQSDNEEESEKFMLGAEEGGQDEDREHMDLDVADVSPQPSSEQLDEGFTATIYPNVKENLKLTVEEPVLLEEPASSSGTLSSLQHLSRDFSFGDQFFSDKHSDADKNAKTEVESMMNEHQQLKATTTDTTTTTTTTLPPQAPQQSTTETMMMKRIGKLEHIMAGLIQVNKDMEERLDSHGDLPEADMKEILHQRMWEFDSYKSHEDHMQLFEALEKSMNRDHSKELAQDLAEARKKRKKSRESPKTPPGSPSHPPPPAGPSGALGAHRASGSAEMPPSPPPPSFTNQESSSKGFAAPSPSKTAEYQAWTMTDIRLRPSISLTPADLEMDEDMAPDEQV
nr:histone deacetylase 14 [Tanacetum cinerariifolium]